MEKTPRNAPNPFVPEKNHAYPTVPPEVPKRQDSARQLMAKRQALRQWYQDRRDALKIRLQQRPDRATKPLNPEQGTYEVMGRWAISQALTHEKDPSKRQSRRRYLMRRWRTFMRQTFHAGPA